MDINIGPQALSGNQVVFYAAFDDGTDGVFTANFGSESKHIVELEPATVHDNVDFGRRPLSGTISGSIFIDGDGNNRLTFIEEGTGFPSVRVSLQTGDGTEIVSTLTAEDGSYEFTDLPTLREYQVSIPPTVERCDVLAERDCVEETTFDRVLTPDPFELGAQEIRRVVFPLRQDATAGQSDTVSIRVERSLGDGSTEVLDRDVRLYIDLDNNNIHTPGIDEFVEPADSDGVFLSLIHI